MTDIKPTEKPDPKREAIDKAIRAYNAGELSVEEFTKAVEDARKLGDDRE